MVAIILLAVVLGLVPIYFCSPFRITKIEWMIQKGQWTMAFPLAVGWFGGGEDELVIMFLMIAVTFQPTDKGQKNILQTS